MAVATENRPARPVMGAKQGFKLLGKIRASLAKNTKQIAACGTEMAKHWTERASLEADLVEAEQAAFGALAPTNGGPSTA